MATLIDGKRVSAELRAELMGAVAELARTHRRPGLAAVLVGEDPASRTYVRSKARACEEAGIYSEVIRRDASLSQVELEALVRELNGRDEIDGILVQSPLPRGLDEMAVTLAIDPMKDVDGFHPCNVGRVAIGLPAPVSCTPAGIQELLRRYEIRTAGAEVVIVGRSNIVGRPLATLLSSRGPAGDATVTLAHSRTKNLAAVCRRADILVAAIGRPQMITADYVKEGAVVIDVGINRIEDPLRKSGYRLVGDVDFDAVFEKVAYITPVPGGVGPMTIALLLQNTYQIARRRLGLD
ncbi:MAG TPA: bifunctional methylenetetrahydrofolate dehydrogenase/methenyltetrahydrofolate cyclohydrolase FolD [candidate division Zixibacteria bacterium]|nr:bifunctional methylenetetrahydrofolate dehydrogenase/methenyltetrahydrofolate cyclohydrolase FolD [candidate division Zixibacteria bacterium]